MKRFMAEIEGDLVAQQALQQQQEQMSMEWRKREQKKDEDLKRNLLAQRKA